MFVYASEGHPAFNTDVAVDPRVLDELRKERGVDITEQYVPRAEARSFFEKNVKSPMDGLDKQFSAVEYTDSDTTGENNNDKNSVENSTGESKGRGNGSPINVDKEKINV
jgi:malate synthase